MSERLCAYLQRHCPSVAAETLRAWEQIHAAIPALPEPDAGAGPDGDAALLCWDLGDHHLEVEIGGDDFGWYYDQRGGRCAWGEDWRPGDPLPDRVAELAQEMTR